LTWLDLFLRAARNMAELEPEGVGGRDTAKEPVKLVSSISTTRYRTVTCACYLFTKHESVSR